MSSSDEFPDWNIFSEREVPLDVELLSPASEVTAILRRCQAALDEAQQTVEHIRKQGLMALAEQAVLVVQLAAALDRYAPDLAQASLAKVHRSLRIIKDQMLAALTDAGLEIEVPISKSFDEVERWVNVDGWRHHPSFPGEVVAEVVEPIVLYQGVLLRPGRVVMGAPPEGETIAAASTSKVEASPEGSEE
jgi:molecular chaperone GrpE (heat shock protein)